MLRILTPTVEIKEGEGMKRTMWNEVLKSALGLVVLAILSMAWVLLW